MRTRRRSGRNRPKRIRGRLILLALLLASVAAGIALVRHFHMPGETTAPSTEHNAPVSEPAETAPAETPPTTEPADPVTVQAAQILDSMSLEEKICQLFLVTQDQLTGVSGVTRSGEATKAAIEKYPVGGIIYFSPNLVSREQCIGMIEDLQSYSRLGLFIAVDEEGGPVTRLGHNDAMGTTKFPAMGSIGKDEDPEKAYHVGYTIGMDIAGLGFNLDFAPVADVNSNPRNPVIGKRAFHSDPGITAEMVAACVSGFRDSGVLCTLKHFPGHGDTDTDSHYGEAETGKPLDELMECELRPFQAGIEAGAPFVMIAHITAPELTSEAVPATLSHEIVTGLLRETMGFEGVVITDSMSMQAITDQYTSGAAAVKALQAGVDIILMPQNLDDAICGISEALQSGTLTESRIDESVLRILEIKLRSGIIPLDP